MGFDLSSLKLAELLAPAGLATMLASLVTITGATMFLLTRQTAARENLLVMPRLARI
jgi:hypothetical protein